MNHNHKFKRNKYYRALIEELRSLEHQQSNLPVVKLETPYKRGWQVYISLRADISRRKDAHILLKAIGVGYKDYKHIKSKKHIKAVRRGVKGYVSRRKHNKPTWVSYYPEHINFTKEQYDSFDPRIKKYFESYIQRATWFGGKDRLLFKINLPNYYLKLKTRANMITHVKTHSRELESVIRKLRNKMDYLCVWDKVYGRYREDSLKYKRARFKKETVNYIKKY